MTRLATRRRFLKILRRVDASIAAERQVQENHNVKARANQYRRWHGKGAE